MNKFFDTFFASSSSFWSLYYFLSTRFVYFIYTHEIVFFVFVSLLLVSRLLRAAHVRPFQST